MQFSMTRQEKGGPLILYIQITCSFHLMEKQINCI
jgi:hypothetical protein